MKCKKCGRTIGVEDKVCPYCQAVNDLAAAHEQNIKEFDKEFSKTQKEVAGSAQKRGRDAAQLRQPHGRPGQFSVRCSGQSPDLHR